MKNSFTLPSYWLVLVFVVALLFFATVFPSFAPYWGSYSQKQAETVTVTGSATSQVVNQVASFSITLSITDDNKEIALNKVNTAAGEVLDAVKQFGIPEQDIKTQGVSAYEIEVSDDRYYNSNPSTTSSPDSPVSNDSEYRESEIAPYPGPATRKQWQATNSIEVILRDIERSSELSDLLFSFPIAQVYGPQFRLDDDSQANDELIEQAMNDALKKASSIAQSGGRRLGKVVQVVEGYDGYDTYPMYRSAMSAQSGFEKTPLEPGATQVSKSLTVTYELR